MTKNPLTQDRPRYSLVVVAHNIRSAHNVGSILRTCECLGVSEVVLTGYTPYPRLPGDTRLPHITDKLSRKISKTSLGAENHIRYTFHKDIHSYITRSRNNGFTILALEQSQSSTNLANFSLKNDSVLILGNEVDGIDEEVLKDCHQTLEIQMKGHKESLNVSVATGIAIYKLLFMG